MARESGGRADKDGNEFERLWVASCALEVIAGRAKSLKWEPPSLEAEGGDLKLSRDGGDELHQCKFGNRSFGKWTVADLQQNRVLIHAESWLTGGAERQFYFVSRDRVAPLDDLAERSRRYAGDDSGLVNSLSDPDQKELGRLGQAWGNLDWANAGNRSRVVQLLRRLYFSSGFWDSDRRKLEAQAESAFIGSGHDIVTCIASYVSERLGQEVYADDLRSNLAAAGFASRDLRHDPKVPFAIKRLQDAFETELTKNLIGDSLIRRTASKEIVEFTLREKVPAAVLVVGGAGSGKSAMLLEVARELRSKGVPFLPVRFDLDRPEQDLLAFSANKLGLPCDPVACLQALAGERRSVLILDQLDAIHWTAAHAAKAIEVVREMLERASVVAGMTVVAACRTFDLEDDRRLPSLFPAGAPRVAVGELKEDEVVDAIKRCQVKPEDLAQRELKLLRNAFALGLWVNLARSGVTPAPFSSLTQLLQTFWKEQRRRLRVERSVPDVESSALLDNVVAYLDKEGRLDAPRLLIDDYPLAAEAFFSLGLLQAKGSWVRFGHQAHADYLVARKIVERIVKEGITLVQWVKPDQSLFRREQVRQALQLLRDEESRKYNEAVSSLLTLPEIRFHMRQLVVQVLRHASEPTEAEITKVAEVIESRKLRPYLCEHLVAYSYPWTKALLRGGLLLQWLESGDLEDRQRSVRILGACASELGDELTPAREVLRKLPEESAQLGLAELLPSDISSDSSLLFEERLDLVRKLPSFAASQLKFQIEWLVRRDPSRALSLFQAAIAGALDRLSFPAKADESILVELGQRNPTEIMIGAFVAQPVEAFDLFLPFWGQICDAAEVCFQRGAKPFDLYNWYPLRSTLRKCLNQAAQELARTTPEAAARIIDQLSASPELDRIAANALMSLPEQEHADRCIRWLLKNQDRLILGWEGGLDGWAAADLIARFGSYCSSELYDKLESSVTALRNAWELHSVRYQLDMLRKKPLCCDPLVYDDGSPQNRYGTLQQILLESLPEQRMSGHASLLAACWRAKFGPLSRPVETDGMSGSVKSPIPDSYLMSVPDSQWLTIVRGDWRRRKGPDLCSTGPYSLSRRSHEAFAADFGTAAKQDPTRFSRLALRLEGQAALGYLRSVLWAVGDPSQPLNAVTAWTLATPAAIEQIVIRGEEIASSDSSIARAFCSAVNRRASEVWPHSAIRRLARYATSAADPENQTPVKFHSEEEDNTQLLSTALNCVRGAAIYALCVLPREAVALDVFQDTLRSASSDPHPAVRIAVQAGARHLLESMPAEALSIFLNACAHQDDRVLASRECRHFLLWTWREHTADLAPLFERMIGSEVKAAAQLGAECATAAWLYDGQLEPLFRRCENGTTAQRVGVTTVAAKACSSQENPSPKARSILIRSMGDPDVTVSQAAADIFSHDAFLTRTLAPEIAATYAKSAAFIAHPKALLRPLAADLSQAGRFQDAIGTMALRFGELGMQVPWDLEAELTTVILSLYESTEDPKIRNVCLDAFDALLRARYLFTDLSQRYVIARPPGWAPAGHARLAALTEKPNLRREESQSKKRGMAGGRSQLSFANRGVYGCESGSRKISEHTVHGLSPI